MTNGGLRKIAVLTDDLGGGTGNHLLSMIKQWDKKRWQVEILSRAPVTSRVAPEVTIEYLPPKGRVNFYPVGQIRALRVFRKEIRRRTPDIVHAYFFWPILFGRLLKLSGTVRTLVENREDQGFDWGEHEYTWLRLTRTAPDRIVCVSDAVKQVVLEREQVDEGRVLVVRNGIGTISGESGKPPDLREELGIGKECLVVGMIANFNRSVKGASLLLDSVPEVVRSSPSARFLLVGKGKEEAALREKAKKMGVGPYVIFAGYRPDIHRCYAIMDVSVLTSFSEGLSITLLESMRCGLPVVATRVGGNPEVVVDGETGYLVPAGDASAFAQSVTKLLRDPNLRRRMGDAGRHRVEMHFRIEDVAHRYLEIYEDAVSKAGEV